MRGNGAAARTISGPRQRSRQSPRRTTAAEWKKSLANLRDAMHAARDQPSSSVACGSRSALHHGRTSHPRRPWPDHRSGLPRETQGRKLGQAQEAGDHCRRDFHASRPSRPGDLVTAARGKVGPRSLLVLLPCRLRLLRRTRMRASGWCGDASQRRCGGCATPADACCEPMPDGDPLPLTWDDTGTWELWVVAGGGGSAELRPDRRTAPRRKTHGAHRAGNARAGGMVFGRETVCTHGRRRRLPVGGHAAPSRNCSSPPPIETNCSSSC